MHPRKTCGKVPSPPAFVTAAAKPGPAATFIPARKMGCLILKSFVRGVVIVVIFDSEFHGVQGLGLGGVVKVVSVV
jgi:hypothetical protein